ncbi:DeoR/GlpR family transcriptional regulator of sugar metabolism [Erwinia persicina]|jgi:DeoR/GlpR family transcriptional regulator of sugar metabolism|uniref:DNA-binding transcriptional regulator YciT n=2 Tax=Erwinia TaxID=551 RepID=A0ABV4EE95_9GAMM|nr:MULTISPECIES: DNA-binding transcriptional regulator YciT [Erwinia]MCP1440852.1 DeoR/GlpR family transcriptional regulator of sugar metabolism [Erwinia persicina]MDN4629007.1 DNA-binding transcriptional regulator YciT [Erwinia sp. PsM31]MDN8543897.1 DNA-binding transcriptional regulator YciT [Erwinia sp. BC051422]
MNVRHQNIIQLVSERGSVSVSELSQITGVSEVTVRQDLNVLEKGGFLRRVHGSAVAPESDDVGARMRTRYAVKKRLAEHAASLVNAGEAVFIEGGSTNALLARELSERRDITIITVSHYIAGLLRETGGEVIILGGLYQKSSESVVGPLTRLCIQHLNFHKVFIGIDGWDALTGFTGRNMLRCDVVNALMAKNTHTIALTDSSKFGQIHPYPLAPEHPFSHVITDTDLPDTCKEILQAQGLRLDIIGPV